MSSLSQHPASASPHVRVNVTLDNVTLLPGKLSNVSLSLPSGSMTLVIGPPGHGKTALLRCISSRTEPSSGRVLYNGLTQSTLFATHKLQASRICALVNQNDCHLSSLSVRETLTFAAFNALPVSLSSTYISDLASSLGLTECLDTIVGNEATRGISGGQRKRLTVAESLVAPTPVLCLDEITTGLDSQVAVQLLTTVKKRAKEEGATICAALLQASPEILNLFDTVICMREGQIVFIGSPTEMQPYFTSLGFVCSPGVEDAEFVASLLAAPDEYHQNHRACTTGETLPPTLVNVNATTATTSTTTTEGLVDLFKKSKLGINAESRLINEMKKNDVDPFSSWLSRDLSGDDSLLRQRFSKLHSRSLLSHVGLVVQRQASLMFRSKALIVAHILQAIILGVVLGQVFGKPILVNFTLKISVVLFSSFALAFANMPEVALAVESRNVVVKHAEAALYPASAQVLASAIVHAPIAAIEVAILGALIYYQMGFCSNVGRFFFFLLSLFSISLFFASLFRLLGYTMNAEAAQAAAAGLAGIAILFSGFVVTRLNLGNGVSWLYYLSPVSWLLRSTSQNEFLAPKEEGCTQYSDEIPGYEGKGVTFGVTFLNTYEMQIDPAWRWGGIIYILGSTFTLLLLSSIALQPKVRLWVEKAFSTLKLSFIANCLFNYTKNKYDDQGPTVFHANITTSSQSSDQSFTDTSTFSAVHSTSHIVVSSPLTDTSTSSLTTFSSIPSVDVAWQNLSYSIPVVTRNQGRVSATQDRLLLDDVTAFARSGELTAIIGRSGAGKTTLLDVLAGLKTTGKIEGTIILNGTSSPASRGATELSSIACYVQQDDTHLPQMTVREAIDFSAEMRLSASAAAISMRKPFVDGILRDLELFNCKDARVSTLRPGELKCLSIGVELAANKPVLLLDEPTSGLDARSAALVVRVLRKIASGGGGGGGGGSTKRTVIATIHQPSAEVLALFDSLLLLHAGGRIAYFGKLGIGSSLVREHFEVASKCKAPRGKSPANWALELLSDSELLSMKLNQEKDTSNPNTTNVTNTETTTTVVCYVTSYRNSALASTAESEILNALQNSQKDNSQGNNAQLSMTSNNGRRGFLLRSVSLLRRTFISISRDFEYNGARVGALFIMSLILGAVYSRSVNILVSGDLQTRMGMWFTALSFSATVHFATALPAAFSRRAVFNRECRARKMYAPEAFGIAVIVSEIPWIIGSIALFSAIFYSLAQGLEGAFSNFFINTFLLSLSFNALAYLLASLAPSSYAAQVLGYFAIGLYVLFGGLFVTASAIPSGLRFLFLLNPMRHAFFSVSATQFYCAEDPPESFDCSSFLIPPLISPVQLWPFVKNWLGLIKSSPSDVNNIAGFYIAFAFAAVIAPRWISHVKR
jgi:ABC-type multidrug transport system ATPase subunit/ABC-type multidrug transport system permease subunit